MSAPSGADFTYTWNLRAGSPIVVTRVSGALRVERYFQPPTPAPASASNATTAVGNFDLGFSDAGALPIGSIGNGCAPESVRAIGGTVRDRVFVGPPPIDRDAERWLPVRGAGAPSIGNRS